MQKNRPPITWEAVRAAVIAAPDGAPRARRFAAASVPQILSDTKRGLVALIMQREGLSQEQARERVLSDDLRHLLPLAPEAARSAVLTSRGRGPSARAAARNAAARCRQALRVVDSNLCPHGCKNRDLAAAMPAAWRPLLDAMAPAGERPRGRNATAKFKGNQATRACLLRVAQFLVPQGIDRPEGLPKDPDALASQLTDAGMTPHVVSNLIHSVRVGRRVAEESGIDVSGIPVWPAKRKGASYSRYDNDWRADPRAGLARDLPKFSRWLAAWLNATGGTVSPATQETVTGAVCRVGYAIKQLSATGLLHRDCLITLTPLDLCERHVPGERIGKVVLAVAERNDIAADIGLVTTAHTVPLIHALTRFQLEERPIRQVVDSRAKIVPPGVRHDIENTWMLVRTLAREDTLRQDATRWSAAEMQYESWLTAVKDMHIDAGEPTARNIGMLLDHLTLPQLVVLGLPWLHMIHLPRLEASVTAAKTRADRRAAENARHGALFRFAALAVPCSVPLRLDQFQFGRVGTRTDREFELQATFDDDGQLTQVTRVTTHFGGRRSHFKDNLQASLKQRLAPMNAWVARPSILHLATFARYLREVWWARALSRGLDRGRTIQQALSDGDLALFLSDRNGSSINKWGGYGGNGAPLADAFGEAMLTVMRGALGQAVPNNKEEALNAGWKYLLTEHTIRHQYATYWHGLRESHAVVRRVDDETQVVRSGSQIAQEATRDSEKTLALTYARVTKTMSAHLDRPATSWAHPYVFNNWMDAAEDPNRVMDWSAAWDTLLRRCNDGADALPDVLRDQWQQARAADGPAGRARRGLRAKQRHSP